MEFHFVNLSVSNVGNRNIIVQNCGIKVSKKQNLLIVPDLKNQFATFCRISVFHDRVNYKMYSPVRSANRGKTVQYIAF